MSYGNLINIRRPGILDVIEGLWPYSYILTVSQTNPAAMFKTIQAAINYQETKSLTDVVILCDAGIYSEALTFTLGSVCLTSLGVNGEVVVTSTDAITITIDAPNVTLKNIAVDNNETGTDGTCVQVAANRDGIIFDNCRFNVTNATVTNAYCADINGGDETGTLFRECTFFLDAGATLNTAIDAATDCIVHIEDGQIESLGGTNYAINAASGSVIRLNNPKLISGSLNGAGSFGGLYLNSTGVLISLNHPGAMPLKVKNTSGATANVNEVGYITYTASSGPEYKTTTTANDKNYPTACVVLVGGANNADIYVATEGEVTLKYSGSAPSAGSFLLFGTTAGQLVASSTMRYELVAVAKAAGASGLVLAQLYTGSKFVPYTSTSNLYQATAVSSTATAWAGTIATLPGGAVLTYTPTAGNEDTLTNAGSLLAALILHNTTRGTLAYISSVNTGTNTITLTANVPAGWATTDVITIKGQTCTTVSIADALEFEILSTEIPALARAIEFFQFSQDSGAVAIRTAAHPYETNSGSKLSTVANYSTAVSNSLTVSMPLINRRFAYGWLANGAGTQNPLLRMRGYWLATP